MYKKILIKKCKWIKMIKCRETISEESTTRNNSKYIMRNKRELDKKIIAKKIYAHQAHTLYTHHFR